MWIIPVADGLPTNLLNVDLQYAMCAGRFWKNPVDGQSPFITLAATGETRAFSPHDRDDRETADRAADRGQRVDLPRDHLVLRGNPPGAPEVVVLKV